MALRWGIASTGKISHDFVSAVKILPKEKHQVVAVAARSLDNAKKFADEFGIPKAYEGYINLAKNADIDVVYVGVLNPQHFEVSKLMLEHGKHVLCEKPLTLNEKFTRELIDISHKNKRFLMEAVWSRCFPVYKELKNQLNSNVIGDVYFVNVNFGSDLSHVERLNSKEMGGGTILDLGVYVLQFQQFVFKELKMLNVIASGHLNKFGTDDSVGVVITYENGKTSLLSTSSRVQLPNEAIIVGTKGTIRVPNFWCPTELILPDGKKLKFDLYETESKFNYHNSAGLAYEAEEVYKSIKEGKIESPLLTHKESIELAKLMDTLRKQVGVIYPQDK